MQAKECHMHTRKQIFDMEKMIEL